MKKFIFYFSLFTFHFSLVKADWVPVNNGITQLNINALTATSNYLFAGTRFTTSGGAFVSTNLGNSWTYAGLSYEILSLGSNLNYVYSGTHYGGFYYSINYGANWIQTYLGRTVLTILPISNVVFTGCSDSGVFISTNYGANWTQAGLMNRIVNALVLNGGNLFAGTGSYGVYLSTNSGTNWTQTSLNFTTIRALAVIGNHVFAGGNGGIYISTDNGINWNHVLLTNVTPMTFITYANNIIEGGGGSSTIYVSIDSGTTWIPRMEGMPYWVNTLCISNGYVFAGTDGHGVYRRPLSELVGINQISQGVPEKFKLFQNYPNPFNPTTKIKFDITKGTHTNSVKLVVLDALGKEVNILVNENLKPGSYEVEFNGSIYSSGVYFYRLTVDNKIIDTKKLILIK